MSQAIDVKHTNFTGWIGIGDETPDAALSIKNTGPSDNFPLLAFSENSYSDNEFALKGYFSGTGPTGNKIVFGSDHNSWSPSIMTWRCDGNVGIGTLDPKNELDVNGTIRAKEVIVETNWPGYVFDDGYELRSLAEVRSHIEENGHLPGVPSASQVAESGVSIGDAQRILLEKIEELTVYTIEKEERVLSLESRSTVLSAALQENLQLIEASNKRVAMLERKNAALEARLAQLASIVTDYFVVQELGKVMPRALERAEH